MGSHVLIIKFSVSQSIGLSPVAIRRPAIVRANGGEAVVVLQVSYILYITLMPIMYCQGYSQN